VGALLVRERGHRSDTPPLVLLGRRDAKRALCPDMWDMLGGHLEPGETSEAGAGLGAPGGGGYDPNKVAVARRVPRTFL
jgi:8-oxo-dGTP pyrophosphatase MutT (NUDIX family)